jgi:glycosyltransferase involved in cell wall biosynthesis
MSIKGLLTSSFFAQRIFSALFKPVFRLLPDRQRNQMMTLAHHIKMIFYCGQVMNFSNFDKAGKIPPKTVLGAASVPPWVVDELQQLAQIEPELYPTPEYLEKFHTYQLPMEDAPGKVYSVCRRVLGNSNLDIVFIAPWLKRGGADLGTLHHINACERLGLSAALITTMDAESPWLGRVAKDIPVVELGRLARELSEAERILVLVRLLLQTKAKTVHIIQSELGWQTFQKHSKSLQAERKAVFASLYCDEYDSTGHPHGYARSYLASTLPHLSGIICDTAYYPKELNKRYGADLRRIHTVYFPSVSDNSSRYISSNTGDILWAGRITQQKRPDILLEIAMAMPDIHFRIKGYAVSREEKQLEKKICQLPNVTFTGPYENGHLVEDGDLFSIFLYTSAWDGLPNVLLEATLAGLPIVASAVGGVSELISAETGYYVDEIGSTEAYVEAIRRALSHQEERYNRWGNALDLIRRRHTHDCFLENMIGIDGYFPSSASEDMPRLRALG